MSFVARAGPHERLHHIDDAIGLRAFRDGLLLARIRGQHHDEERDGRRLWGAHVLVRRVWIELRRAVEPLHGDGRWV